MGLGYQFHAVQRSESRQQIQGLSEGKKQVQSLLDNYQVAVRSRNPQLVAGYYAPVVETYFLKHNLTREDVEADLNQQLSEYTNIEKFETSNLRFSDLGTARIAAMFTRKWDFRGTKNNSGSTSEQMVFQKVDGGWKIVSQRDFKSQHIFVGGHQ